MAEAGSVPTGSSPTDTGDTAPRGDVAIPPQPEPQELAELAAGCAEEVGKRIRTMREEGVRVAATKSSITDVVTAADREAERLLVEALTRARPEDGVLGEEGAGVIGTSGITWVLDPIDGTVNYLYDIPAYAVSVAATVADPDAFADGRRAIAGAVYNPRTGELFHAWHEGGAYLNGTPIRVVDGAERPSLAHALVGTGFGYTAERRKEQASVVAELLPQVRDIRRIGAASYDLCLLAAGRLDAYYERGLQPWDYAAGAHIAHEAGARLLGRDADTPPGEPLLVAAAPGLAEELRATIVI